MLCYCFLFVSKRVGFAIENTPLILFMRTVRAYRVAWQTLIMRACNEIDDAFLLQAEIGIVYFSVLDDSPLPNHPLSSTLALALALRP